MRRPSRAARSRRRRQTRRGRVERSSRQVLVFFACFQEKPHVPAQASDLFGPDLPGSFPHFYRRASVEAVPVVPHKFEWQVEVQGLRQVTLLRVAGLVAQAGVDADLALFPATTAAAGFDSEGACVGR